MGMIWTRRGWRVEASAFARPRTSRSLRCAAKAFRRIFFVNVTRVACGGTVLPAANRLLCHTGDWFPGGIDARVVLALITHCSRTASSRFAGARKREAGGAQLLLEFAFP